MNFQFPAIITQAGEFNGTIIYLFDRGVLRLDSNESNPLLKGLHGINLFVTHMLIGMWEGGVGVWRVRVGVWEGGGRFVGGWG